MEFEIESRKYRTNRKLNAFEQLHVARKIAPLITTIAPTATAAKNQGTDEANFFTLMGPVIEGLAAMNETDVNYITQKCLSVVQRFQGGTIWAPMWNEAAKRLMIEDIDAMELLLLTWHVIQENLSNFMRAPALSSPSQPQQTSGNLANMSSFPTMKAGF